MEICPIIDQSEMDEALSLIRDVFMEFEAPCYPKEGVEAFFSFIENEKNLALMEFWGAYDDRKLQGVIATKDNRSHICCFFVKSAKHRQGIGRALWERLLAVSSCSRYTVNSSPYAVGFYHKLGFVDTDVQQLVDGIYFTPMEFIRQQA